MKTKSASNPRNKDAAIEISLSTLKDKLWIIEFLTNKSKILTKREWGTFYNIKNATVRDKKDYIKDGEN